MKYLIIYDHIGEKVMEQQVFVDGNDWEYHALTPECIWLGTILIVDKEPELTDREAVRVSEGREQMLEAAEKYLYGKVVECYVCKRRFDEDNAVAFSFGHDDWLCPMCGTESLREVTEDELEKPDDKGIGDSGISEASELKDTKDSPKRQVRKRTRKADKRHRQSEST